jgi:hypothetical protein
VPDKFERAAAVRIGPIRRLIIRDGFQDTSGDFRFPPDDWYLKPNEECSLFRRDE